MAEYAQGEFKQQVAENALNAYLAASENSKKLSAIHPITLGLSLFYNEVLCDNKKACEIAKITLAGAIIELPQNIDEDDEQYRDSLSIINLPKENLEMWSREEEENNEN